MANMMKRASFYKEGVALYVAITITGALVLVSFAIINIALKQITISTLSRDSQAAFYAADSGAECALFWDLKNSTGSAFSTSSATQISCFRNSETVGGGGSNGTSTFDISFAPDPYCANVTVAKWYDGPVLKTRIESKGYNTCDTASLRRVERAIEITY